MLSERLRVCAPARVKPCQGGEEGRLGIMLKKLDY